MRSITEKIETLRIAKARARLLAKPETLKRLLANDLPKKDVLPLARAAGVMAAKKTPDIIPYCHPLPIDSVAIQFEVRDQEIEINSEVIAIWKTGVEMEALVAVSIAALTVYDMLKPIDKEMEIVSTQLLSKKGGKTDFKEHIPKNFSAAILVTSDGTHEGRRQDKSGKMIEKELNRYQIEPNYIILPDEKEQIARELLNLCEKKVNLILTTGGTGLGPRDVTVEATHEIMEREIPGIMEAARSFGQRRTPYAMLSRGLAAQRGNSIIINLPGSSKGVRESLDAIFPAIFHAYKMMRGLGH